ncbi:quaternary amine ABC transporter ATP-binding protein [Oceanibacterium hippocampi]|uniref:Quaternary amine transport ATP-binding protein n=1 Tax=Oceanibacterium hippocampi TaxID=745714 RepID=A0A1Y5RZ74_9PROT|nr:glycine betaine/L-proline ABC transporter ATP-binding protein [Oceanibacterium hippocampi]SLN25950.1 Glycine betaine/carnitine transport ATP-binding protein GbuA [Oceanibacterium hippocampi]
MTDVAPKLEVSGLYKIFGPSPERALARRREGGSKDRILSETGDVVAVSDISFSVREGEFFVVMGLSGSGKSTLIRCLNRLIDPTAGRILVDGEDVAQMDAEALRQLRLSKMAMVFQHFALFPHRTVGENVEFGLKMQGVDRSERRDRALEALDLVELRAWADRSPAALSGGMRQRVGLARALAVDPQILLMDEPFGALDPLIRRDMQEELITLQRRFKKTIIFITHDLHEALRLGDRVAIMRDGRFVQVGAPQAIVDHPEDPYVAAFTQDVDRGRVFTVETIMREPETLVSGADDVDGALRRLHDSGRSGLVVTGADGGANGVVGLAELSAAASAGGDAGALSAATQDVTTVAPETALADIYDQCTAGLPIAVVDKAGSLCGVVEPLDVFTALTGNEGSEDRKDAGRLAR